MAKRRTGGSAWAAVAGAAAATWLALASSPSAAQGAPASLPQPALAQPAPQSAASEAGPLRVETIARGLENPWGLAFLPDGRMLVTERPGRLRVVERDGALSRPLGGVPSVAARGQGGLLDVAVDPGFAQNRLVYLAFSEPRSGGGNGTAVLRGRLNVAGTTLEAPEVIFRQQPAISSSLHFGSRLVFDRTGALFVTLGDRFGQRDEAQTPGNTIGKLVRVRPDGAIPDDNPKPNGWRPEIWSIGHRNVQAAALHPQTGQIWTAEHGAKGGDEINAPKKGLNYGWPVITYGVDYSGARIGVGTRREGLEQPIFYWDPSIAPSGMAFVTSDRFPGWRGSVLVGALAGRSVSRLVLDGERVVREERLLGELRERIRDVREGPDGLVYLLTDAADGRILRVRPEDRR